MSSHITFLLYDEYTLAVSLQPLCSCRNIFFCAAVLSEHVQSLYNGTLHKSKELQLGSFTSIFLVTTEFCLIEGIAACTAVTVLKQG